jgi:hypothetical protein
MNNIPDMFIPAIMNGNKLAWNGAALDNSDWSDHSEVSMEDVLRWSASLAKLKEAVAERDEARRQERVAAIPDPFAGWQKLHVFSHYFGCHEERGEGDVELDLVFDPQIEIPQKYKEDGFGHGSSPSQLNDDFSEWLGFIQVAFPWGIVNGCWEFESAFSSESQNGPLVAIVRCHNCGVGKKFAVNAVYAVCPACGKNN